MFIVTMVFLVSLIFVVQQTLLQYTSVDTVNAFYAHDTYLQNNIKEMFQETIYLSSDCTEFDAEMQDLADYLNQQIFIGGYSVDLGETISSVYCSWPNRGVDLEIKLLRGVETESKIIYHLDETT